MADELSLRFIKSTSSYGESSSRFSTEFFTLFYKTIGFFPVGFYWVKPHIPPYYCSITTSVRHILYINTVYIVYTNFWIRAWLQPTSKKGMEGHCDTQSTNWHILYVLFCLICTVRTIRPYLILGHFQVGFDFTFTLSEFIADSRWGHSSTPYRDSEVAHCTEIVK